MSDAAVVQCQETLAGLTPLSKTATALPDSVVFESRGCVLVVGDDASVGQVAQRVAEQHSTVVFAPGVDQRAWGGRVTAVGRQVTYLRGHLGAFQASVGSGDDRTDIGVASANSSRFFDLVLDLGAKPLIQSEVKPYGYFAPGRDEAALVQALAALRTLVGRFSKPRYFEYNAALCAHGVSGVAGCTQCLYVCSAQAIRSGGNRVEVDAHLCQGCASCTLACPTGALTFKPLARATVYERLRRLLAEAPAHALVVVHQYTLDAAAQSALAKANAIAFQVDPLPAFGDELWLRTLALGARALVLVEDATMPELTHELLARQIDQLGTVLLALGLDRLRIRTLSEGALLHFLQTEAGLLLPLPSRAPVAELGSWTRFKRLAWIDSLRQLAANSPGLTQVLSTDASLGAVQVNQATCTLCFACVNVCPTRALKNKQDTQPQLVFQESACVQCGLCVAACPEHALSLVPRVALRALSQMSSVVIQQDALFKCTSCGTPFISEKMLASSLKRLQGHTALDEGTRAAIMTCPSCRQREMLVVM